MALYASILLNYSASLKKKSYTKIKTPIVGLVFVIFY